MQTFAATDADAYKNLARAWAATVTVVTARRAATAAPDPDAPPFDGFTATAFLTVSIAPPIVLVSATNASSALAVVRDGDALAVNLLRVDGKDLAGAFARPRPERAKAWGALGWHADAFGAPLLDGALGAFSATLRQLVDAGDHTLALLDVTAIHKGDDFDSLVYHNRAYGRVTALP